MAFGFLNVPLGEDWEHTVQKFGKTELINFLRRMKEREETFLEIIEFHDTLMSQAGQRLQLRHKKEIKEFYNE